MIKLKDLEQLIFSKEDLAAHKIQLQWKIYQINKTIKKIYQEQIQEICQDYFVVYFSPFSGQSRAHMNLEKVKTLLKMQQIKYKCVDLVEQKDSKN